MTPARGSAAVLPLTLAFVAQAHVAMAPTSSAKAFVIGAGPEWFHKIGLFDENDDAGVQLACGTLKK